MTFIFAIASSTYDRRSSAACLSPLIGLSESGDCTRPASSDASARVNAEADLPK